MQVLNGDARIDVRVEGDGETIVLIHGFPLTKAMWDAQIAALAPHARVVALDLRGMGASSVMPGPYLMETLAGDVAAVLDQLDARRATLVGHSLGGYVALAFARMYLERLSGLVLVSSRIDADTPERAATRREQAGELERTNDSTAIIEAMARATLAEQTRAQRRDIVEKFEEISRKNDPRGLASMLRGMAMRDSAEDIASDVRVPVMIVAGAADSVVSLEEASRSASAFPAARFEVVEGAGHVLALEAPDRLAACLVDFVRQS